MDCSGMIFGLIKHTLGFVSSLSDMGTDLFNALDMMGIFKSPLTSGTLQDNQVWGIMSLLIIFLPGFIYIFPVAIRYIGEKRDGDAFLYLVFSFLFPVIFIIVQLWAIIKTSRKQELNKEFRTNIAKMTSAEATFESTGQLLLQSFTLLNGYPPTTIQTITICTSILLIGRAVILQDIETEILIKNKESLTCCKSLAKTLERIPFYVPNIFFRTGSLAVTIAYLRVLSPIPIFILLLELGWLSWNRFRKLNKMSKVLMFVPQLLMSNMGVLNIYPFGMDQEYDEKDEDVKKFIILSTLVTFIHHTIVIVIIMIIGYVQPDYFISALIFTPRKEWFYILTGSLIGIGALNLAISVSYVYCKELSNCFIRRSEESVHNDNSMELEEKVSIKN